jgi:hypothetical protein
MSFVPSPFWGGVLAVTFYQLVFTNPVSFLSLGLGMVIGFGLSLYTIGVLVVRGYISATQSFGEALGKVLRENPMIGSIFGDYISNLFRTCYPRPWSPTPSFTACPTRPTNVSGCPMRTSNVSECPMRTASAAPNLNIGDILSLINSVVPERNDETTEDDSRTTLPVTVPDENPDEVSTDIPNEEPETRETEESESGDREETFGKDESDSRVKEENPVSPRTSPRREDRRDEVKPLAGLVY